MGTFVSWSQLHRGRLAHPRNPRNKSHSMHTCEDIDYVSLRKSTSIFVCCTISSVCRTLSNSNTSTGDKSAQQIRVTNHSGRAQRAQRTRGVASVHEVNKRSEQLVRGRKMRCVQDPGCCAVPVMVRWRVPTLDQDCVRKLNVTVMQESTRRVRTWSLRRLRIISRRKDV